MKIVSETQYGDVIIESDTMLMSEVKGNVTVLSGAKLNLISRVEGDVILKKFALPEAQMDRFLLQIKVGYPTLQEEQ
ncbi:hypothetical protein BTR23_04190 [Alkalihalophilus pseudofirmus]|nr:hypothetical protein BTR23_04190 [Alkalihalophilus pseudofirmus]